MAKSARDYMDGFRVDPGEGDHELPELRLDNEPLDWSTAWDLADEGGEWIVDDVLARERGHAMWARGGTGKSEFALWVANQAAQAGHLVVYVDLEMGARDVTDRQTDMGYSQDRPHEPELLRYIPAERVNLPPLDTEAGATALAELLERQRELRPGRHLVVFIDTIGRAVQGPESDADTYLAFHRHTGMMLRRLHVTWLRLDHTGWEAEHSRGSSAKYDDVDVVWKLTRNDSGVSLCSELGKGGKSRMGWVPHLVEFERRPPGGEDGAPLAYWRVDHAWLPGTRELAARLDALGLPLDVSERAAGKALRDVKQGRRAQSIRDAIKYRRGVEEQAVKGRGWTRPNSGTHPGTHPLADDPDAPRDALFNSPANPSRDASGTHPDAPHRRDRDALGVPLGTPCGPAGPDTPEDVNRYRLENDGSEPGAP